MSQTPLLRWGFLFSIVAITLAVALRLQNPLTAESDLGVVKGGVKYCYSRIRTQDTSQPSAQCFTVEDGKFSRVWTEDEPSREASKIKEKGGYVIPGLWDSHGHLLQYGQFLHSVDLFGSKSLEDVRDRIKAFRAHHDKMGTKDNWIRGVGWDQAAFGRMPTAADLKDPDLDGLYIMLDRIDVHCTWVSQAILDLLPSDMPDIPGGEIIREPGMGVFCDNAMTVVMDLWPKPKDKIRRRYVKAAMEMFSQYGLVGMHDAGSTGEDHRLFDSMADEGEGWSTRVYAMLECDDRNTFCGSNKKIERDDSMFTARSVKLFADGALGSWGSALLEPYSDRNETSGSLLIGASDLTAVVKDWAEAGYQVNVHAIGDLAVRGTIDAFEVALRAVCPDATNTESLARCQGRRRFRIEHSQIIHPDDQRRMRELGIIPSIQPTHATSDMKYALSRLGPDRVSAEAYRMKSLLGIGPGPLLGSDFPVEPPNPFHGIYAAVTRKSPATGLGLDNSTEGWHTEEALSFDEALWGFTGASAFGAFLEDRAGVIKKGAFADWVVLDEPIEDMDIERLRTLKVRETWVAGKMVYQQKQE